MILVVVASFLFAASFSTSVLSAADQEESSTTPDLQSSAIEQINALAMEKASRTPAQRKISSQFIYAMKIRENDELMQNVPALKTAAEIAPDDTTLVDIKARVTPSLLREIERIGGKVINSFEEYGAIRARLRLETIESLAANPDIRFIGPAHKAFLKKVNTSEGDWAHSAATARTRFGVDGTGIKIGVLSDSVDHLADAQASGDLPEVTVLEDAPGNDGEGTAMLEIVHDLAPGAQLYFATAWNGPASFASNILALARAGCRVIVDDVGLENEFPFQDDIISQAVNTVTANGALYFSSAGNEGNLDHDTSGVWEGNFLGMTEPRFGIVHDFGGGNPYNRITEYGNYYELFWADPLEGSANDYDLFILTPDGSSVAYISDNDQDGDDDPIEIIYPETDITNYLVLIHKYSGKYRFIHFTTYGGRLLYGTDGQIRGHPAALDGFGVAAVDAKGRMEPFNGTESVEDFSTDGPRRVFFNPDGTPITPGNFISTGGMVRKKPDIAAADGVRTATPGFDPFYGTSAAAPHAAAIAGLMLSAKPNLTVAQVRNIFKKTALDIEAPGWDPDSGYGIIMADAVLGFSPFNPGVSILLLSD